MKLSNDCGHYICNSCSKIHDKCPHPDCNTSYIQTALKNSNAVVKDFNIMINCI